MTGLAADRAAAAEETVLPPGEDTGETDIAALAAGAIDAAEGQEAQEGDAAAPVRLGDNLGISDEQDFEAVAERETIESDAERLERMQATARRGRTDRAARPPRRDRAPTSSNTPSPPRTRWASNAITA